MSERLKTESLIRDWLADHLDLIAPGLKLIEKEYYLPDEIGARGFVDLLCNDAYGNFLIIEIKRSESSARQTISEVLKYHSLIKHNLRARESELKIVIISTHWKELIRPFSETVFRTTLDLSGYRITINEASIPVSIEKVEPIEPAVLSRKFAYWYGLYMFETDAERSLFFKDFEKYLLAKDFEDFILIKAVGDLTDRRIIFPYSVIAAFQKLTIDELLTTIKNLSLRQFEGLDSLADFEEDEQTYHQYLEGCMIDALDTYDHPHESEACYPQKITVMINGENWVIQEISRFGLFKKDPRYTDELLISELTGLDGNNENVYFGIAESTQIEKIKEIKEECQNSLMQSPVWLETINVIMGRLSTEKRKFRLMIHVFNPDSLIVSIYHTIVNRELGYLPTYFLSIDYLDNGQSEVYHGAISWDLNSPTSSFLRPFPKSEKGMKVFDLYNDPDNVKDAKEMSLGYTTSKYVIVDEETEFQGFVQGENGVLVHQGAYLFSFAQYAVTYRDQLEILVANHNLSYSVMRR